MVLFSRKQGRVGTVRAMSRFTEDEREHGMDMLQAAESVFVELGAPSRLGTALFATCVHGMGVAEDSPAYGVAAVASLMGYACRMASPGRDVPANIAGAIESQLVFTDAGEMDYEVMANDPDRLGALIEYTATLADNPAAIAALADATGGAWQAFATTATFQLHKNLVANGLAKRALPPGEGLENLLRLGYAIRLIDEVAGEQPIRKDGLPFDTNADVAFIPEVGGRQDGPAPAEPLDVESWLTDTATVCVSDFEPFAERLLELATLERLEILSVMDGLVGERPSEELGDEVVTAMANARVGYALRNRETQLLGRSDFIAQDDPIAALLEERLSGDAAIGIAVIHGVLRDVLVFQFLGGREALYAMTPGTTPQLRREAIEQWASQYFPGDGPRTGRDVTVALVEYGYFLHRVFEICPDCLEDWS